MKNFKSKTLAVLLALFMVVGVFAPSMARADGEEGEGTPKVEKTEKVTLHKILMDKTTFEGFTEGTTGVDGTKYKGQNLGDADAIKKYFGGESKEIAEVFFAVMNEDGTQYVKKDGSGLLEKEFKLTKDTQNEVFGGLTTQNGLEIDTTKLLQDPTTYKIVEVKELSTYDNGGSILTDSKAVPVTITLPFVNEDGVVKEVHVYPKNTENKPKIDKDFADANENTGANYNKPADPKTTKDLTIGDSVPYNVKTLIPAKSEYKKLVWTDMMSNGLTFDKEKEVALVANILTYVKDDPNTQDIDETQTNKTAVDPKFEAGTDYKLITDDRGFTLRFTEKGLNKLAEEAKKGDIEFELNYSATLNGNAVVEIPEENDIKLDYGNKPGKEFEEKPVTPFNNEITVSKTWADGSSNQAPDKAKVTYTLKDGVKTYSVTLTKTTEVKKVFKLGDGITFEVTGKLGDFAGTFKGLDGSKTYKIFERVSGYDPTYTVGKGDGTVAITNNKDTDNPTPLDPTEPKVVTYGKKFVKTDKDDQNKKLAGAEFVVKNGEGKFLALKKAGQTENEQAEIATKKAALDNVLKEYNNLTKEQQEKPEESPAKEKLAAINKAQKEYNDAFIKARFQYQWVDSYDTNKDKVVDENIVLLVSNDKGEFEITGLKARDYKLVETKAPEGYALPTNPESDFKVDAKSYNGPAHGVTLAHIDEAQQITNQKVTIPQTGGMGTILFTVIGAGLMGSAVFAMKKKDKEEEEEDDEE